MAQIRFYLPLLVKILISPCFPHPGRKGMAITLVTQYDIHLVHAIEEEISKSTVNAAKM